MQIKVVSRRDAFWRCGHRWTAEAQTVKALAPGEEPSGDELEFTAEQVEHLRSDPMLIVVDAVDSREDKIRAAIADLDRGDESLWMGNGKPKLDAVRDRSGLSDVTAAERDRLFTPPAD